MDKNKIYEEVPFKNALLSLDNGEAYICEVYKKLDGGKSFHYQYLSYSSGNFLGLKEGEEVISVLLEIEQDPVDETNIKQAAITEYPDKRLKELGLENSEIENLRAGFVVGFKRAKVQTADLIDCFRSFIRSKFFSSDWENWLKNWNNKPDEPKKSWDEKFNEQADANLLKKGSVDWSEEMKIKDKILQKSNGIEGKIDNILAGIHAAAFIDKQDYAKSSAWVNPDSLNLAKRKLLELFSNLK